MLTFRRARLTDWPQLQRLYREGFPERPEKDITYFTRDLLPDAWVLVEGPKVAAAVSLCPRPDVESLWLEALAVHRDYRRRGLGADMLERAHTLARTRGYGAMALAVRKDNLPARTLYEQAGYTLFRDEGTGVVLRITLGPTAGTPKPPSRPLQTLAIKIAWRTFKTLHLIN